MSSRAEWRSRCQLLMNEIRDEYEATAKTAITHFGSFGSVPCKEL